VKGRPTRSDEFRDVAVAGHFPIGNLLDGAVDGVEEGFCFWCSFRHSCLLGAVLIEVTELELEERLSGLRLISNHGITCDGAGTQRLGLATIWKDIFLSQNSFLLDVQISEAALLFIHSTW